MGGGGGAAGNVDRVLTSTVGEPLGPLGLKNPKWNVGIGIAVGNGGGAGGDGRNVFVDIGGEIVTHGSSAFGLLAQSVGGGGGILGEIGDVRSPLSWGLGSNGDSGNAGLVSVAASADITTAGNSATGIFAQSAAGEGFGGDVYVGVNNVAVRTGAILDPTLGSRDLDLAGNPVRGLGAVGIMAQSVGNGANNSQNGNIAINILGADALVMGGRSGSIDLGIQGGSGPAEVKGVGIAIIDGNSNTVRNEGLVTTRDGVDDGYAILARGSQDDFSPFYPELELQTGGKETIFNLGTVTGSVSLGAGTDAFINEATGTLNAGAIIDLGIGELFTNRGILAPGGDGNAFTTTLDGDLLQSVSGVLSLDVLGLGEGEFDRLFVTGDFLGEGLATPGGFSALAGAGSGLDGTLVFNLLDALILDDIVENFTIFDFLLGGTPDAPTMLTDSSLFAKLKFMGVNSGGSFDLRLASDGSFNVVPLPAGVWLFGSALGMLGWLRRRGQLRLQ